MTARVTAATPRRSTRSQSREVESIAGTSSTDTASSSAPSSSSAVEASPVRSTASKRGRRTTKSTGRRNVASRVNGDSTLEEQAALSTTIIEEDASEVEHGEPIEDVAIDETIVVEHATPRAKSRKSSSRHTESEIPARQMAPQSTPDEGINGNGHYIAARDRAIRPRKARQILLTVIRGLIAWSPYLPIVLMMAACLLAIALPSPQKPFQRNVYVDENALQPGSANVEFSWADVDFADKVAARIRGVADLSTEIRAAFITTELRNLGYTPHNQSFTFDLPNDAKRHRNALSGINTYARWPAARGDGKEAFVISVSWKSSWDGSNDPEDESSSLASFVSSVDGTKTPYEQRITRRDNVRGIATALAIARHLIAYRQWSKDLIFVFADGELEGMQAWTSAYFGSRQSNLRTEPLAGRGALLWNALSLDYPSDSFSHIEIRHEGLNGQLPNLDVISTLDELMHRAQYVPTTLPASSEDEIADQPQGVVGTLLDRHVWASAGAARQYVRNFRNLLRQASLQSACHPSGTHGLFHKYHVDAVTVYARPAKGPHGFYSMGRMVESMTRSMSNLLERLHHSHFFYMLTSPKHFVEVAKYLPVASLLSAALLLSAIAIWLQEGRAARERRDEVISAIEDVVLDELDELSEVPPAPANDNAHPEFSPYESSDARLQQPTTIQSTQKLISVLVQRSAQRGDLVGSAKIRVMAALLQSQGRPVATALAIAASSHIIGLLLFRSFTAAPVDCARYGIFQCRTLRSSTALLIVGILITLTVVARWIGRRFTRCLVTMQNLLPDDALAVLLPLRHADQRAVARTVLMVAMLEAGIVTLIVSIVNFGLAAVLGAILAPALCSIRLCASSSTSAAKHDERATAMRLTSPASDDSDSVDAMLPARETSSSAGITVLRRRTRMRFALHGIVLLSLVPPPLLYLSKGLMALGERALLHHSIARHLPYRQVSHVLIERLVDGALWDYHILSSMLLPLLCSSYVPILLMSAQACLLMALASNAAPL